ncbi:ABC transporter permease [Parabacteroides sp.]
MYRQYLRQAWQLMKQNSFFSTVYIIGTGLAISMVMVMAIAYHIRTSNMAPEVHRDRMLYATFLEYAWGNSTSSFFFSNRTAKECLLSLQTAEEVAVTTEPTIMSILAGDSYARLSGDGDPYKVSMMGTNDGFWRLFDFSFIDGKPFGEAEFQSALPRVVVSESLAKKLFSRTDVSGQGFLLDDVEYIVSGVVKDVSFITPSVAADLWVPYTCLPVVMETGSSERDLSGGFLVGYILPARGVSGQEVAAELDKQIERYNSTLRDGKIRLMNGLEGHGKHIIAQFVGGSFGTNTGGATPVNLVTIALCLLVLLFLLIPALNLSGLNASHMQDRIAELGVRKAFGARRMGLVMQVLIENMVLMLPGGLVGLLFSYLLIILFRNLLLTPGMFVMMTGGANLELTPGMMMNPAVFGYAFLVCLLLNFLSSVIPVWRAVQVNTIEAIKS